MHWNHLIHQTGYMNVGIVDQSKSSTQKLLKFEKI